MEISPSLHICAYLDVLGGTKLFECVDIEASEGFIEMIYELERRLNAMRHDGKPVVRTFTDNVFAAYPLEKSKKFSIEHQVGYFISEISAQLQQIFMLCELPLRGAITIGDVYIDDRIVIGEAMVRAVKLEQTEKFPRVVLDPSVLRALPKDPLAFETIVYTAKDGVSSLNYLGLRFWCLKSHRRLIERRLTEFASDPRTQEKYRWLLEYHESIERRINELGLCPSNTMPA